MFGPDLDDIDLIEALSNQWLDIDDAIDIIDLGFTVLKKALRELYEMLEKGEIEKVKKRLERYKEVR